MTAICGGGPSQPKDPTELLLNLTAAGIIEILTTGGMGWMGPLAAGLGYLAYDLSGLCATDPPAVAAPTAEQIFSFTNPLNPQGAVELRTYVGNLLGNYLWHQYCECVTGPQPPPFTGFPEPTGQETNPGAGAPTAPICGHNQVFSSGTFNTSGNVDWSSQFVPSQQIPVGAQWVTFSHCGGSTGGPSPYPVTHSVRQLAADGTTVLQEDVLTYSALVSCSPETVTSLAINPSAHSMTVLSHTSVSGATTWGGNFFFDYHCNATPPGVEQPCCPPDPTLENLIIQVLQLEQLILNSLGGSARYTRGLAHTGLTGSGTISVTGLFGVLIELTTGVPTSPELPGVPPYQFSVGWVSCLTGDGMIDEIRITRQAQVWGSRLAPFATQFGYQLNAGFTATITELLPA